MHVRTALARRIVTARRFARCHPRTARTIGTAALAGTLLVGVGASIATADTAELPEPTPVSETSTPDAGLPVTPGPGAADPGSADPGSADPQTSDPSVIDPNDPMVGDDEDVDIEAADVPAPTSEELAAQLAASDQDLQARAANAEHKVKIKKLRSKVIEVAKDQIGDRYVAGSSGPNAFDCSGLVRYVYKQATGRELPHHSRAQYGKVERISRDDAQPGDLVFFFRNGAHHVGIYIGGGKMIDAPGRGAHVRVSPISGSWWGRTYTGMGRIIDPV